MFIKFYKTYFLVICLVLLIGVGVVSANDNVNNTLTNDLQSQEIILEDSQDVEWELSSQDISIDETNQKQLQSTDEETITVNTWDELQYYCSLTDKDYTLKLKENTNFYPSNPTDTNQQIKIKNNVKIIGSAGSYIGDNSSDARMLKFVAFLVEDNINVGLTLDNITFKWIQATYPPKEQDGIFIQMGGKKTSVIKNCKFSDIKVKSGHATIVYLKKGSATLDNCSFINCTSNYGVVSIYDQNSVKSVSMVVRNCYFENNYAETEPGCINNCGKLTVYNTTFIKNRSFWWAGAIHTHYFGNTTIYDSKFIDNVAGWNGGALYTYSYLQIYNSVFIGNNCTTNNGGGAIGACQYQSDPHIYIEKCLFENNANNCWALNELSTSGTGRGGAISLMDAGSIEVRDTTFIANEASIGTAICAIEIGGYGSPDIIIVNNTFINHTRMGDVLNVRVNGTILNLSDNYFYGNSIVFSNLTLTTLNEGKEQAILQVNVSLSNPSYYDDDILDKTLYDVYINNKYVKTVNTTVFTVDFGDLDVYDVYVIPTISNRKSNEVTITSTRAYVFVSKSKGNDSNSGVSRNSPVSTIKRALELANVCQNILLLDGDYSENDIHIDYGVTIKGEGNATLTGTTSFISNANFTLKNLKINNLNRENFIKQNNDNLVVSNCIFTNNNAVLVYNNGFTSLTNSILLNNSKIVDGNIDDCVLDYNWWGNVPSDLNHYITLNLTSDVDSLENNQKTNVKAVFYLNDGSIYTKLPDINLDITALNGVSSQNIVNIGSSFTYTLTAFDDGVLIITYNNVNVTKSFEFLKSNPGITLNTNDLMVGETLTVTVAVPGDAEGNLTVNIGNLSQTKAIQSTKTTFTFENLKADTYAINLTFSGDKKYISQNLSSSVKVSKYNSNTKLELGNIEVGENLTITVSLNSDATGIVTLHINGQITELTLSDAKANYTIPNIQRGDYRIAAVYGGDDKYLGSESYTFIEVDNLDATMAIKADDITYGGTAVFEITLNSNATGNVLVTVDGVSNTSQVINGIAEVYLNNLDAGIDKIIQVFYSGDDTYYNLTETSNFTIKKADLTFTITSEDIMVGQNAVITIIVPKKTTGTFTIQGETINIPMSGEIEYVLADLEIGEYDITAVYDGNNYNTVMNFTSFSVMEYDSPQWPNSGSTTDNIGKSEYESNTNGEISYIIEINDYIIESITVDSEGNIYITTPSTIYSYDNMGNLRWNYSVTAVDGNFSGTAISRDVIIAPKSGDTLYFINQTSGERYGSSNIYQGSSFYAPIVDDNANLYIVSERDVNSNNYKLVKITYNLWYSGGDPILVDLGTNKPIAPITFNNDIIVVLLEGRLRVFDINTLQAKFSRSGSYLSLRPVIGDGNIIYAADNNRIFAYTAAGSTLWFSQTMSSPTQLLLNPGNALYYVSDNGLYACDLDDGKQSLISSLKITSDVLIDAGGNLYFGCDNLFYCIDSQGNVLWKSDLSSKITGKPVMDSTGTVYVTTVDSRVYALTYADIKNTCLSAEFKDNTLKVTLDNQSTGFITFNVNGVSYREEIIDGNVVKTIANLPHGNYNVNVTYLGDLRFASKSIIVSFAVKSADVVNVQSNSNTHAGIVKTSNVKKASKITAKKKTFKKSKKIKKYSITLKSGKNPIKKVKVTIKIGKKTYSAKTNAKGKATFKIKKLTKKGKYSAVIKFAGNKSFKPTTKKVKIVVK